MLRAAPTAINIAVTDASLVNLTDGGTVQDRFGANGSVKFTYAELRNPSGVSSNLLIRNPNAGATRVHIEPNGSIVTGVSTKLDWMFDPYDSDGANYRIFNIFNSTGDVNGTGESGITFLGSKNTGNAGGLWSSMHFGFSDDGASACAFKIHYIDTTQPSHYTPAKGAWRTGKVVTAGDYVTSLSGGTWRIYQAAGSGTCGSTVPSHTTGSVSDGGVTWDFVRAVSSENVRPIVVFGDRDSMPKLGLTANVQHAREEVFWNNIPVSFLDQAGAVAWSIKTTNLTDDLAIQNADGTRRLRFDATGQFVQAVGLAVCSTPITPTDGDTTPSIKGVRSIIFGNTGATSVTAFDDGVPLQEIIVRASNGNTTLVHSASLRLVGKTNRVLTANDCLMFVATNAGTAVTEVGYRD